MYSSIDSGGKTHIRYAHNHYPRKLELKCKKCNSKANAINTDVPQKIKHIIDISNFNKKWNVVCSNCVYRDSIDWNEIRELELWFKLEIRNINFWAWNREHLEMVIQKLKGNDLKLNDWKFFETYIPKKWLTKLSGEREIKKLVLLSEK